MRRPLLFPSISMKRNCRHVLHVLTQHTVWPNMSAHLVRVLEWDHTLGTSAEWEHKRQCCHFCKFLNACTMCWVYATVAFVGAGDVTWKAKSFQSNIRSNNSIRCRGRLNLKVFVKCRIQPAKCKTFARAVDKDLRVEMSGIILNYCYVCCSETTLLFVWNVAVSIYQITVVPAFKITVWLSIDTMKVIVPVYQTNRAENGQLEFINNQTFLPQSRRSHQRCWSTYKL